MLDDRSRRSEIAVATRPRFSARAKRAYKTTQRLALHVSSLVFALGTSYGAAMAAPNLAEYNLIFGDDFSGSTLDASKWNTGLLWGPYLPINNEEQLYVDTLGMHKGFAHSPFELTGTSLKITATPVGNGVTVPPRPAINDPIWDEFNEYRYNGPTDAGPGYRASDVNYLSGMITSYDSFRFTHGYIESRVKLPAGRGLWPAFWALNSFYVEDVPEIDVMEFLGHQTDRVYHTYHYFEPQNNFRKISTPSHTTRLDDFTQDWHTFGMEWGPKEIIWYVDGEEAQRVDTSEYDIANQAMYLLSNLAVGGNWPGSPDADTAFPATYEVDYIRAYQRKAPAVITRANLSSDYELMFQDNFNGSSLNRNLWNSSYLWGPYFPINGEQQIYPDMLGEHAGYEHSPFSLDDGVLSIIAQQVDEDDLPEAPGSNSSQFANNPSWQMGLGYRDPDSTTFYTPDYVSGILTTYDSFKFVDGYAEIRAKLPRGAGLWSNFKLSNAYYVDQRPEIGIMDALGNRRDDVNHYNHYSEQGFQADGFITTGDDYTADFHRYGVHWQKGKIDWYIDGEIVQSTSGPGVSSQMMYLVLNLAVGGDVAGDVNENALPREFQIDYVRVWQQKLPSQVANNIDEQEGTDDADTDVSAEDSDDATADEADTDVSAEGSDDATADEADTAGSAEDSDDAVSDDGDNTSAEDSVDDSSDDQESESTDEGSAGSSEVTDDVATVVPQVLQPANGSTVTGSQAAARWGPNETAVTEWWLRAGSERLGTQYFDSQRITSASTTTRTIRNLPQNGSTVYVTLYYKTAKDGWASVQSTFNSAAAGAGNTQEDSSEGSTGSGEEDADSGQQTVDSISDADQFSFPTMLSPIDRGSLAGASSTFRWSAGQAMGLQWWLKVGSSAGGEDYFSSGRIDAEDARSVRVTGLPEDGSEVFATLYYKNDSGTWNASETVFRSLSATD